MKPLVFIFLLVFFWGPVGADEIEFKASVNADKIGRDDVLIFTVTYKGVQNPPQPDISAVREFRITQTSQSTEYRFVNGVSSHYTHFEFYLEPLKIGILTIPEISYNHRGTTYRTPPFKIEVVEGSVGPSPPPQRRKPFFDGDFFSSPHDRSANREIDVTLDTWVSEKEVVVGQQILAKILLYTRNRVDSINIVSNQTFPGFWQEWFPVPRSIDGNTVEKDGKTYQVYEIRKVALFPRRPGTLDVPSLKFELSLSGQSLSFFSTPRKIFRESPSRRIKVRDTPPEARGLPVGEFSFDVRAQKTQLDINDILTLEVKIEGRGNLKTIGIPEFTSSEDFKAYPAKISRSYDFQKSHLTGALMGEIPVAFKTTGSITLPPLDFRYYSPEKKKVIGLTSSPIGVTVTGTREIRENAVSLPSTEIIKKGEDIDFIVKGHIHNQGWKIHRQPLFVFLLVLPFFINLVYFLKKTVLDRILLRNRLLNRKIRLNTTIKRLRAVNDHGEIHVIVENHLQQQFGMNLSEITNEKIESFLKNIRVSDYDISTLIRIKSESESSRFSPQKKPPEDLKRDVDAMISTLKRIDRRLP